MSLLNGWGMDWNPWSYYSEAFDSFIRNYLGWILLAFFGAVILACVITTLIKRNQNKYGFDFEDGFKICGQIITWSLVGLVALFVIVSTVFCSITFFSVQVYNVVENYYTAVGDANVVLYIIAGVIGVGGAIWWVVYTFQEFDSLWWLLLTPIMGGISFIGFLGGVGFVIYSLIHYIWMLIRFLYVIITAMGISFYQLGAILVQSFVGNVHEEALALTGWGMDWNPWNYYSNDFDSFVMRYFLWFFIAFGALTLGGSIFATIKHFASQKKHNYSKYKLQTKAGLAISYPTLGLIAIFIVVSTIFCLVSFFSIQYYDVVAHYYGGLVFKNWILVIVCVIASIVYGVFSFIFAFNLHNDLRDNGWLFILWGFSIIIVFALLYFGVGFLIYSLIYYLWMLVRFIYIVLASIGISIYQLGKNYWYVLLAIFGVPSVLFGLYLSLASYINSLKHCVVLTLEGGERYLGFVASNSEEEVTPIDDTKEEVIIEEEVEEKKTTKAPTQEAAPSPVQSAPTQASCPVEHHVFDPNFPLVTHIYDPSIKKFTKKMAKEHANAEVVVLPPYCDIEDFALEPFKHLISLTLPKNNIASDVRMDFLPRLFGVGTASIPPTLTELIFPEGTKFIGSGVLDSPYIDSLRYIYIPSTLNKFEGTINFFDRISPVIDNKSSLEIGVHYSNQAKNIQTSYKAFRDEIVRIGYHYYRKDPLDGLTYMKYAGKEHDIKFPQIEFHAIDSEAFYYIKEVDTITLPNQIRKLSKRTFYECSFKKIVFSIALETLPSEVCIGCHNLSILELPSNLKKIESRCFALCDNLKEIDFSNTKIQEIQSKAFASMKSLTKIILPYYTTFISDHIFEGCDKIKTIEYKAPSDDWYNYVTVLDQYHIDQKVIVKFTNKESCLFRQQDRVVKGGR